MDCRWVKGGCSSTGIPRGGIRRVQGSVLCWCVALSRVRRRVIGPEGGGDTNKHCSWKVLPRRFRKSRSSSTPGVEVRKSDPWLKHGLRFHDVSSRN